ncbi:MAG: hypothetical protein J1F35_03575 [Erysipelotrichales bacterium]|nr:hypothetical protein [Erysipelotrichales bacterium]
MKKISEILNNSLKEGNEELVDDQWINDEKPVKTMDGRQAIITDINMKEVPNILIGQVRWQTKLLNYEWQDDGVCIKATDQYGNPKKPTEADYLVKDFV